MTKPTFLDKYQEFKTAIVNQNYELALSCIDFLLKTAPNEKYHKRFLLYLYMLSWLVPIKENQSLLIQNLIPSQLVVDNREYGFVNDLINQQFTWLQQSMLDLVNVLSPEEYKICDRLSRSIKNKCIYEKSKYKNLLKQDYYYLIINVIRKKEKNTRLTNFEKNVCRLCEEIIFLKKRKPFVVTKKRVFSLIEALDNHDYEQALYIQNTINKNNNSEEGIIDKLLQKIMLLVPKNSPVKNEKIVENQDNDYLSILVLALNNQDFCKAHLAIDAYLKEIDKSEYFYLIKNLIKISIIEGDIAFIKPILTLLALKDNTFILDLDYYIECFNNAILNNRYREALIYFNILNNTQSIGFMYQNIGVMYDKVNELKRSLKKEN